ncbi:pilus assembly protein [Kordiimonas pumila]|uniref:Pilus assembly protein TadG-related protein n=1 Tax=Kordiimonas pumila TaxID=2161677 RepID=A0ABV7D6M3_9PROT|nr:Tad domain-containing protein [Kordiimonas pumila]
MAIFSQKQVQNLLQKGVTRLWQDQTGSLMPIVAASMLTLTGAAGLAIDGGRMFLVKDVLQKSLDSAGLAAGHAMEVENMESDAHQFFDTNIRGIENIVNSSEMRISFSNNNKLITLYAEAKVSASFVSLFGYDEITVTASTEIARETRGMELVLVMDNTGSMRGSKITAMKDAAESLVEYVYGDNETSPNLWVGLVPYVAVVNIGTDHDSWLTSADQDKLDTGHYAPTDWKGCVMARTDGEDETDTVPSDKPFSLYFWPDSVDNDWIEDDGDYDLDETNNAQNNGRGPNLGCGPAITSLVAEKSTVIDAIDEMLPWHRGGTTSNLGLVWAWRVLSPAWQGLWGGDTPATLPLPYDAPYMDKVVVVLTDGQNQFYDWPDHGPTGTGPFGSDFTGYDRLNTFGYSTLGAAQTEIDSRFSNVCTSMKTEGIIIYSITFGSTPNSTTQALYRGCASNPAYYFHAPSNAELETAFEEIGRQLSNLRLSK